MSEWGAVSVGVPQDLVLGPLLLSIATVYIIMWMIYLQLWSTLKWICTYADDTELHLSGHDLFFVQHDFQCGLDAIQIWFCANRLQLNVSKSVVMLIGTKQKTNHRNVSIHISGQVLTQIPHTKYVLLGSVYWSKLNLAETSWVCSSL